MNRLLYNFILALTWVAITGHFTLGNAVIGFLFGYLVLLLTRHPSRARRYVGKIPRALALLGFFLRELLRANFRVAYEVLTPGAGMRPAVVAIPLDARRDFEILLLSTLINLTPDSLTLAVSEDRRFIYVHSMFVPDVEEFRRKIKNTFERRILEVTR